jgi:hypothetical protein
MTKSDGSWGLALTPGARKQLVGAERGERELIDHAIMVLADNPRIGDGHKIQGSEVLRKRAGDWRVFFKKFRASAWWSSVRSSGEDRLRIRHRKDLNFARRCLLRKTPGFENV